MFKNRLHLMTFDISFRETFKFFKNNNQNEDNLKQRETHLSSSFFFTKLAYFSYLTSTQYCVKPSQFQHYVKIVLLNYIIQLLYAGGIDLQS